MTKAASIRGRVLNLVEVIFPARCSLSGKQETLHPLMNLGDGEIAGVIARG